MKLAPAWVWWCVVQYLVSVFSTSVYYRGDCEKSSFSWTSALRSPPLVGYSPWMVKNITHCTFFLWAGSYCPVQWNRSTPYPLLDWTEVQPPTPIRQFTFLLWTVPCWVHRQNQNECLHKNRANKIAFQWDAYRPLLWFAGGAGGYGTPLPWKEWQTPVKTLPSPLSLTLSLSLTLRIWRQSSIWNSNFRSTHGILYQIL